MMKLYLSLCLVMEKSLLLIQIDMLTMLLTVPPSRYDNDRDKLLLIVAPHHPCALSFYHLLSMASATNQLLSSSGGNSRFLDSFDVFAICIMKGCQTDYGIIDLYEVSQRTTWLS